MTVHLVIPLPKIPYIHRIYMVLANPEDETSEAGLLRWHFSGVRSFVCAKNYKGFEEENEQSAIN